MSIPTGQRKVEQQSCSFSYALEQGKPLGCITNGCQACAKLELRLILVSPLSCVHIFLCFRHHPSDHARSLFFTSVLSAAFAAQVMRTPLLRSCRTLRTSTPGQKGCCATWMHASPTFQVGTSYGPGCFTGLRQLLLFP